MHERIVRRKESHFGEDGILYLPHQLEVKESELILDGVLLNAEDWNISKEGSTVFLNVKIPVEVKTAIKKVTPDKTEITVPIILNEKEITRINVQRGNLD